MSNIEELKTKLKSFPRKILAFTPTPLTFIPNLTHKLNGPNIFFKRDDQTGLAIGGNKTRKLEFLMGDVLDKNQKCVITGGGMQSNHCRQTVAAAKANGLKCIIVLFGQNEDVENDNGNVLLYNILGVDKIIHEKGKSSNAIIKKYAEEQKAQFIPIGGSNSLGTLGQIKAMLECIEQCQNQNIIQDKIIFASSSGGTHAGLVVCCKIIGLDTSKIIGIRIDKHQSDNLNDINNEFLSQKQSLMKLAKETTRLLGQEFKTEDFSNDFNLVKDYGEGPYAVVSDLERNTILTVAQSDGILLDPVYTGRAMGGLIQMIKRNYIKKNENVIFLHTGGTPALFAYKKDLYYKSKL